MDNANLEIIVDGIFELPSVFKKLLFQIEMPEDFKQMSKSDKMVLKILKSGEMFPVSEIARRMGTSKPHITMLIDKLMEKGLVERLPNAVDRRVINIKLTLEGHTYLDKMFALMKQSLREKLAALSDADMENLAQSLQNIQHILSGLQ